MKPKKTLSAWLVLGLLLTLLPTWFCSAQAAENDDPVLGINSQALAALGISADATAMQNAINSGVKPYGTAPVNLYAVRELLLAHNGENGLYDEERNASDEEKINAGSEEEELLTLDNWQPKSTETTPGAYLGDKRKLSVSGAAIPASDFAVAVAFNATVVPTSGDTPADADKDNYVALVQGKLNETKNGAVTLISTTLTLVVYELLDNDMIQNVHTQVLCTLPFEVYGSAYTGYLALDAGDFDGDDLDELAVYVPLYASGSNVCQPRLVIYEIADNCAISYSSSRRLLTGEEFAAGSQTVLEQSGLNSSTTPDNKWRYYVPTVGLTAFNCGEDKERVAVTVNVPRYADYKRDEAALKRPVSESYSQLYVLYTEGNSLLVQGSFPLRWNWNSDLGVSTDKNGGDEDAAAKWEMMLFAGVDAGDMDFDGVDELVVAGYRLENTKATTAATGTQITSHAGRWYLSADEYIVCCFEYQAGLALIGGKPQWISIDGQDYQVPKANGNPKNNNSFSLGASDANVAGGVRYSDILNTMAVCCFAERGAGLGESVLVNGLVLALSDTVSSSYGTAQGYGGSNAYPSGYSSPHTLLTSQGAETFRVRFATDLQYLDDAATVSIEERMVATAVAGNFDGNNLGKEQVAFTYITRAPSLRQCCVFFTLTGMTGQGDTQMMDSALRLKKGSLKPGSQSNQNTVENYSTFLWQQLAKNATGSLLSCALAAPDVGQDSIIMRYRAGETPYYWFSTPDILCVLQAAPYFAELNAGAETYTEDTGSTSITRSTNTAYSSGHEITVNASPMFQVGADIGGAIKSVWKFGFNASFGWGTEHERSVTTSVGYSTGGDDTVVIYTVPYVTYPYEVWDRATDSWQAMNVSIPETPRVVQLAVDDYDAVASVLDYATVRDNLLGNSQAGDPASYFRTPPNSTFVSGSAKNDGYLGWDDEYSIGFPDAGSWISVGYGGGAASLSVESEESNSSTFNAGRSFEFSFETSSFGNGLEISGGIEYANSFSWSYVKGMSYEAEVADIPAEFAADYSFQFKFGPWTGTVTQDDKVKEVLVLGYLVRNVRRLPMAPDDLNVYSQSQDQITLAWSGTADSDLYYRVYRYVEDLNRYWELGVVNARGGGAQHTFTDPGLRSNTTFRYAVRTCGYVNGRLREGLLSELITVRTNPAADDTNAPLLGKNGGTVNGKKASSVTLSVDMQRQQNARFQWQRYGSGGWRDLSGETQDSLSFAKLSEIDGGLYRCEISQLGAGQVYILYTPSWQLRVGDYEPQFSYYYRVNNPQPKITGLLASLQGTELPGLDGVEKGPIPEQTSQQVEITTPMSIFCFNYSAILQGVYNVAEKDGAYYLTQDGEYYLSPSGSLPALAASGAALGSIVATSAPQRLYPHLLATVAFPTGALSFAIEIDNDTNAWLSPGDVGPFASYFPPERLFAFPGLDTTNAYQYFDLTGKGDFMLRHNESGECFYASVGWDIPDMEGEEYLIYPTSTTTVYYTQHCDLSTYPLPAAYDLTGAVTVQGSGTATQTSWSAGATLELYATVNGNDGLYTASRRPLFVLENTTSGSRYIQEGGLPDAYGVSTASWTPTEAGLYRISVEYAGDSYLAAGASDTPQYYYAYAPLYGSLIIGGQAKMEYGTSQTLTALLSTFDGLTATETPVSGDVTYTVYNSSGRQLTGAEWLNGSVFTAGGVGVYTVKAAYTNDSGQSYLASKVIRVSKATLTVAVNSLSLDVDDVHTMPTLTVTASNGAAAPIDTDYLETTLTLEASKQVGDRMVNLGLDELGVGNYTVQPAISIKSSYMELYDDYLAYTKFHSRFQWVVEGYNRYMAVQARLTDLYSKYDVKLVPGTLTLTDFPQDGKIVFVTAARDAGGEPLAGANPGTVRAWLDEYEIGSGGLVEANTSLRFRATAAPGYYFDHWQIGSLTANTPEYIHVVDGNAAVTAVFISQTSGSLSLGADLSVTLADGAPLADLSRVPGGSQLLFSAAVAPGQRVASWTVNGVVQQVSGSQYALTMPNDGSQLTIGVTLEPIPCYTVTVSAGVGGAVTLSGAQSVSEGGSLTVSAVPANSRLYFADWLISGGNSPSSTDNPLTISDIKQDMTVQAVFKSRISYAVRFDSSIISASLGGQALSSGDMVYSGNSVVFTANPPSGQYAEKWLVGGIEQPGQTGNTFIIPMLTDTARVSAVFADISSGSLQATRSGNVVESTFIPNEDSGSATVSIAQYGTDGKLKAVYTETVPDLAAAAAITVNSGAYFSHQSGDTYKVFVISNSTCAPLCPALEPTEN